MSIIEFWDGATLDVDIRSIASTAVPVKGKLYTNPCRLLDIYGNTSHSKSGSQICLGMRNYSDEEINSIFLPKIPGVTLHLGEGIYHPPFIWSDCHPTAIATSFTYSTNAIYRILSNLAESGHLPENEIEPLLDRACLLLTSVYKSNQHSILKHMNNNLNMYLISKVVEVLVGKKTYDVEYQEMGLTSKALKFALTIVEEHAGLTPKQQMALALGKGVAFVERHAQSSFLSKKILQSISEVTYKYTENGIAIDDRDKLIEMIVSANEGGRKITMCAILDDTAESIDDLLWMQQLIVLYPYFNINLLVNTAQVSINFASHMLDAVFQSRIFLALAVRLGSQLTITRTYCPLISLQSNLFDASARKAILEADFVFVKGLNFFETCQLKDKDVFHSFVVYGPISRTYTGLPDLAGVFAFLPAGVAGYEHSVDPSRVSTLATIWHNIREKQNNSIHRTTLLVN